MRVEVASVLLLIRMMFPRHVGSEGDAEFTLFPTKTWSGIELHPISIEIGRLIQKCQSSVEACCQFDAKTILFPEVIQLIVRIGLMQIDVLRYIRAL